MSRLDIILDWNEYAKRAGYNANQLAQLTSVSPSQLRRYFLRVFQLPTQCWLNQLRLQRAVELLCDGRAIKEIAYELHYADTAHFCHRFKAHFGCTPSAWVVARQKQMIRQTSAAAIERKGFSEPVWKHHSRGRQPALA